MDSAGSRRAAAFAFLAFAATSCGPADNDPGPGGVTVGEARALDEAAEMLEQQRLPDEALKQGDVAPSPTAELAQPDS